MSDSSYRYPTYKRATAAVVLLVAGIWMAYLLLWPKSGAASPGTGIPVGSPASDFELQTVDGKSYKLSDLRGNAVMINFFTTWCPPCRAEMPILQETFKEYEVRGFIVMAVNLNESDVAIRSFQDKLGLTFPIVVDKDDRVSRLYDILPLPTSYFVDRMGIVQGKWTGEIGRDQLLALIAKIL